MNEQKIIFFILCGSIYFWFMVHRRFLKENVEDDNKNTTEPDTDPPPVVKEAILNKVEAKEKTEKQLKRKIFHKKITEEVVKKDTCSVSELFTIKASEKSNQKKYENVDSSSNTIAVIGITVFLVILVVNAALDVLKVREEEKLRLKLNPDGERRQSLAEFANKKSLRRESSKFSLQLFQIAESFVNGESETEETKTRRETRPYTRGESTTSYFSEKKTHSENSAPASIGESSGDPKMVKRQSASKLIGARPVPMVRRSSFPALPLNPEVQALMLGNRQPSFDSDDEDGKGRRVRIIRRY